jgi:hypothetical protein
MNKLTSFVPPFLPLLSSVVAVVSSIPMFVFKRLYRDWIEKSREIPPIWICLNISSDSSGKCARRGSIRRIRWSELSVDRSSYCFSDLNLQKNQTINF